MQDYLQRMADFDIPASWQAGVAVMPNKELTLMLDVQQILYSGVKSIANPLDLLTTHLVFQTELLIQTFNL